MSDHHIDDQQKPRYPGNNDDDQKPLDLDDSDEEPYYLDPTDMTDSQLPTFRRLGYSKVLAQYGCFGFARDLAEDGARHHLNVVWYRSHS